MTDLVTRARNYATYSHARINHLRKYSLQPYDVHLSAVAKLVASVTDDPIMIAAAWLHDTVEDTPVTFDEIEREFGSEVMLLVKELTDISKPSDGNRAVRKAIDRQHSAAASPHAKTVKLADVIDNCQDICRHDPEFGRIYLCEIQSLMDVLHEGNKILYASAQNLIARCTDKLGIAPTKNEIANPKSGTIPGQHGIRLFTVAFSARDVQKPLQSFDAESLQSFLHNTGFLVPQVFGIRTNGTVTGYMTREDLAAGTDSWPRNFDRRQMVGLETSIADVIHILTAYTFCFVELDGTAFGVIRREDMEKPVVRMWLFGIIILIEIQIVDLIRNHWPNEIVWSNRVSKNRLEKAKQLQAERIRRGLDADLLSCLQFSDKLQIVLQDPEFLRNAGFTSQSSAKKTMKDLESLRNNLAHGQDITNHDWPPIVRLAQRVQELYRL